MCRQKYFDNSCLRQTIKQRIEMPWPITYLFFWIGVCVSTFLSPIRLFDQVLLRQLFSLAAFSHPSLFIDITSIIIFLSIVKYLCFFETQIQFYTKLKEVTRILTIYLWLQSTNWFPFMIIIIMFKAKNHKISKKCFVQIANNNL